MELTRTRIEQSWCWLLAEAISFLAEARTNLIESHRFFRTEAETWPNLSCFGTPVLPATSLSASSVIVLFSFSLALADAIAVQGFRVSVFRFIAKEPNYCTASVCLSVELISQWPFSVTYLLRLLLLGRVWGKGGIPGLCDCGSCRPSALPAAPWLFFLFVRLLCCKLWQYIASSFLSPPPAPKFCHSLSFPISFSACVYLCSFAHDRLLYVLGVLGKGLSCAFVENWASFVSRPLWKGFSEKQIPDFFAPFFFSGFACAISLCFLCPRIMIGLPTQRLLLAFLISLRENWAFCCDCFKIWP